MAILRFRDLSIGDVFAFDHADVAFHGDMAHGPFMKTGARTYRATSDMEGLPVGGNRGMRVGTIRVTVRRGDSCGGK